MTERQSLLMYLNQRNSMTVYLSQLKGNTRWLQFCHQFTPVKRPWIYTWKICLVPRKADLNGLLCRLQSSCSKHRQSLQASKRQGRTRSSLSSPQGRKLFLPSSASGGSQRRIMKVFHCGLPLLSVEGRRILTYLYSWTILAARARQNSQ